MEIWERSLWTNPNIQFLFDNEIIEYDLHNAGLSISKALKLLDANTLEELSKIQDKHKLVVALGNLQKTDKEYSNKLKDGFSRIRKKFIVSNDLMTNQILSIKKDAIFTTEECKSLQFDCCEFRPKNVYKAFMKIGDCEIYYKDKSHIDIKGINDDNLALHKDFIISIISTFCYNMLNKSKDYARKTLIDIANKYKHRELRLEYYREFNKRSSYMDEYGDYHDVVSDFTDLYIGYNYIEVLSSMLLMTL